MWSNLRIAAPMTDILNLPRASKRSQKARTIGLWVWATMAGRYNALRNLELQVLARRVRPRTALFGELLIVTWDAQGKLWMRIDRIEN